MKILKCKKCGNVIYLINEKNMVSCCGEEMIELTANTVDAAKEKHVPVVSIENNVVEVNIGDVDHPMLEEHYIEFVLLETNKGVRINKLNPGDKPHTSFVLEENEELLNTYAYCNLHGLWKA